MATAEVEGQARRILKRLMSDKKTVGGVPHFVLARTMGTVDIVNDVPERAIAGRGRDQQLAFSK